MFFIKYRRCKKRTYSQITSFANWKEQWNRSVCDHRTCVCYPLYVSDFLNTFYTGEARVKLPTACILVKAFARAGIHSVLLNKKTHFSGANRCGELAFVM
jgi:hypothetical protein